MAVALSHTTENNDNLETYCLIWLDASVNNSPENRQAQKQLQIVINHLLTFEDDQQCLQYIKKLSKDDRIVLIVSGRFGRQIVPQIVNLQQINSIYVYCFDKKANEQWSQQFTKVKGVLVRLDELIQQIQKDYTQQQHMKLDESLSIKVFDDKQFLHSQLLIDCLIRMKSSLTDKNDLISFCKKYYKNNNSQLIIIKEFENDYSSERSLWWYTRHAFLSRLLNKALRDENIDLLFLFRFIIHDIGYQLGKNRSLATMRVYRSQLISTEELHILKTSIGKCISINSFLSADTNSEKTRSSLHSTDLSNGIEKVFFEIEANPQLRNTKPFSNIQSQSYFPKTNEVLFMVGSIFRIDQVKCHNDKIWNVRLILCSLDDQQLKPLFQHMKNELGTGKPSLLRFGHVLYQMNKLNNSDKYYRRCLNQLPSNHPDIPSCYYALGMIEESKKKFGSSIKWYKRSIEQTQESDNPSIAETYNNIANVCSKTNNHTKAIKSYQKALDIWEKTSKENNPRIVKCLNNMGASYDMKKKYAEALECYQKALEISEKTLAPKDPDIAMTLRNIANVYELKGDFQQALSFYQKAVKTYRYSLPSTQIHVNDIETSIGRVSSKLK